MLSAISGFARAAYIRPQKRRIYGPWSFSSSLTCPETIYPSIYRPLRCRSPSTSKIQSLHCVCVSDASRRGSSCNERTSKATPQSISIAEVSRPSRSLRDLFHTIFVVVDGRSHLRQPACPCFQAATATGAVGAAPSSSFGRSSCTRRSAFSTTLVCSGLLLTASKITLICKLQLGHTATSSPSRRSPSEISNRSPQGQG